MRNSGFPCLAIPCADMGAPAPAATRPIRREVAYAG